MARYTERKTTGIYELAEAWRESCLKGNGSLLWPGEQVWTVANLDRFKACFIDKPDESEDSFEQKFQKQLEGEAEPVTKLACEILLVYFLFTSSVHRVRKQKLIETVAAWKKLIIGAPDAVFPKLLDGIGGTGQAYNTRRPFELAFIAKVAIRLLAQSPADRKATLADHLQFRILLDEIQDEDRLQSRHTLLHLLFPDQYERIASVGHKGRIAEAFGDVVGASALPDDTDDRLYAIRQKLQQLLPDVNLDFYCAPLRSCWYEAAESDELSPLQALEIKKQIVFYGPPGTGKTHEAKALAELLVRRGVLQAWKPGRYFTESRKVDELAISRVRRVQFHPGYGYEDFVRGLQLADGGRTVYRPGVLLRLIDDLAAEPEDQRRLPFVVILDEMNRADLSKVLGECFSLLEDRDGTVQLGGQDEAPRLVRMPLNLFFIGTMNLIDQSLEQVDFALRRRFLWFFRGFKREDFLAVAKYRWEALRDQKQIAREWDRFAEEFEILADRAIQVNRLIETHPFLGRQYQIGHTYFCDVVSFAGKVLAEEPKRQRLLFTKAGDAHTPVERLWRYSLKPLIEQYLSGVDTSERDKVLRNAESALMKKASA
ncbi:MAG: AAA family ATPase [Planctomycetota bacterium]